MKLLKAIFLQVFQQLCFSSEQKKFSPQLKQIQTVNNYFSLTISVNITIYWQECNTYRKNSIQNYSNFDKKKFDYLRQHNYKLSKTLSSRRAEFF